jgi:hypothetical protein
LKSFIETEARELQGQKCIQEAMDGDFFDEIPTNMDVVVYSESKANGPLLGRSSAL